ncbi:MAG: AbrB/MazE/SpoVT family DNA-binding domain-containing protein [Proteobacteria bacterium]|nr:AbrB/MazE/SpoVT family DNA-binding domain-containing protein [Pseudomonadota bacterium]
MEMIKSKVDQAGRILVPASYRHLLHLTPGQDVILHVERGELRIRSSQESATHARNLVKKYNSKNQDLVELLFQARKEEVSRG